jgi:DNA polymerase-3 subunit beta
VLIEKQGDQLTMLATDIEIQIRTTTGGHIGGDDASITVGARKLQDILRALPDTADVSLTLDDKRLTLKAGKSRFQLQTLPAADYPRLATRPKDASAQVFTIGHAPSSASSPWCSTPWRSRTSATTSTACC